MGPSVWLSHEVHCQSYHEILSAYVTKLQLSRIRFQLKKTYVKSSKLCVFLEGSTSAYSPRPPSPTAPPTILQHTRDTQASCRFRSSYTLQ